MMHRAMVVLMLCTALAGCSDDPPPPELSEESVPKFSLAGVVVDEAIRTVAGAQVLLQPGDATAVTGDDGRFLFEGLDPGAYTLTITAPGFLDEVLIAAVASDGSSELVKVVLLADSEQLAYMQEYHFEGFYECGVPLGDDITCSNINIITWIILGIGNVTGDRSLFLQWLDGIPDFLQTELVWESTQQLGERLGFAVGGATEEQLSTGQATTHNYTFGPSSLVLTIPGPELQEAGIGADRAFLSQVFAAPYQDIPGGCVVYTVCGPGLQLMQEFETFTHAFYNFQPPAGWSFTVDGSPSPP